MVKVSKMPATQPQAQVDRCHRCGGLMVSERVHELAMYDWHCISCGERIDPVILAHRRQNAARSEPGQIGTCQEQLSLS